MGDIKKWSRQEWLLSNSFIFDPFPSGAFCAETDPLMGMPTMPSYVDLRDIELLIGTLDNPGPCYIFSKPGGGKSSLRMRIRYQYEAYDLISQKKKPLVLDYVDHSYSVNDSDIVFHIKRIITLVEMALSINLDDLKTELQKSPKTTLINLVKVCEKRGFLGFYILVDNISNQLDLMKISSLMRFFAKNINLQNLFIVKYFIDDHLFPFVRNLVGQNKFTPYLLILSIDEINRVLQQRLLTCLDQYIRLGEIEAFAKFCDNRSIDLLKNNFLSLGNITNSPRIMWMFGHCLFEEYIDNNNSLNPSVHHLINEDVTRKTYSRFINILHSPFNKSNSNFESLNTLSSQDLEKKDNDNVDKKVFKLLRNKTDCSKNKIYLCHAEIDKESVKSIYLRLLESGFSPWMYYFNSLAGLDRREQRTVALSESNNLLVFLSKNSAIEEGFFQKEIVDALDIWKTKLKNIPYLIPVRLEECNIPYSLSNLLQVDLFDRFGWDKLVIALQESKKLRENQDTSSDSWEISPIAR